MGNAIQTVRLLVVGTIIGIASMLPGLSAAVLAVCLGVYERLIEDIADLRHKLMGDFRFILMIGCGLVLGTVIASFGLKFVIDNYAAIALVFFIGLIIGQLPSLVNQMDRTSPVTSGNAIAFAVALGIMILFMVLEDSAERTFDHNLTSYICMIGIGAVFAISHLVPGISGTTVMIVLGVFTVLIDAVTEFDFAFLIPIIIGMVIGVLGFAKVVNYAIKAHRNTTYSMILGLTLGSIGVIVLKAAPEMDGIWDMALCVVFFFVGILVSIALSRLKIGFANEGDPKTI